MILPALKRGGYTYLTQQLIGERFGGGSPFADVVAEKEGQRYLVSLKWQQVSATAEQKVPFEVICPPRRSVSARSPGLTSCSAVRAGSCGAFMSAAV
jgi:hypothetical protein